MASSQPNFLLSNIRTFLNILTNAKWRKMFKLENLRKLKFMWENVDIFTGDTKDNNKVKVAEMLVLPRAWPRFGCSQRVLSATGGTVVTLQPASSETTIVSRTSWPTSLQKERVSEEENLNEEYLQGIPSPEDWTGNKTDKVQIKERDDHEEENILIKQSLSFKEILIE